ncbi:MAG: FKBP-type peptidyl-prolyl cis-trans isomerase [Bacteroidota bacterium]
MRNKFTGLWLLIGLVLGLSGCGGGDRSDAAPEAKTQPSRDFQPYQIADSSAIITYPNGLKLYVVQQGPGEFAREGMDIVLHYHGMLESGEVFDSTFERARPFNFRLGQTAVISGLAKAVEKLRFGSKAVAIIPPALAYSNREDRPANIPKNSTLIFHIELLGTF